MTANLETEFLLKHFWILDPAIVKDPGIDQTTVGGAFDHARLIRDPEITAIYRGSDLAVVSHNACGLMVHPWVHRPVVAFKMQHAKHETHDLGLVQVSSHSLLNNRQVILMHHLIPL